MLSVFILLKICQFWIFQWIIIFLLSILKCVIVRLVLIGIVSLSLHNWVVTVLIRDDAILANIATFFMKQGDIRAGTDNPGRSREIHTNLLFLLGHHLPVIMRQEPLAFIGLVISGGFDKASELVSSNLR